jgi:hypothetical protein
VQHDGGNRMTSPAYEHGGAEQPSDADSPDQGVPVIPPESTSSPEAEEVNERQRILYSPERLAQVRDLGRAMIRYEERFRSQLAHSK